MLLYRSIPGSRAGARSPVVSALRFDGSDPLRVEGCKVSWTPRAGALFKELLVEGCASGLDKSYALPYASLRASIAALLPEATLLERELGLPWSDTPRSFLDAPLSEDEIIQRLEEALRLWTAMALRPWAAAVGASEALVDALDGLGLDAFAVSRRSGDLVKLIGSDAPFPEKRDAILQRLALGLEGQELFEGQGPVWRIVRAHGASNAIEFITWPLSARDALQSMVAKLTVETLPFSVEPIVTVRASRRRWLANLPHGNSLFGQRSIGLTLMSREAGSAALEVGAPVRTGQVLDPIAPEFLAKLLRAGDDLGVSLDDMVARGANGPSFVGVPYSPKLGGSHPLGAGVSTRDQLDLFDAVSLAMEDGFAPLPFEETAILKKAPKRPPEHHKALEAEALLADVAVTIGRNDLDDDASIEAAWHSLSIDGETPAISANVAQRARAKLEELRRVNSERVGRAFGEGAPRVVVLARTEDERRVVEILLTSLFGQSIEVEGRPLPAEVHGARASLPVPKGKPGERFEARVSAWRPLTETLRKIDGGCHVLVQATDWYDGKPDDPVNKLAGRYALAAEANANVQYLRPRAPGHRGFANYLHRVQAAIYDLVFGHSGLVSDIGEVLAGAFPDEDRRPTSIIGISVLTQARTRIGSRGGRLCLATRIDSATNRTTARVGWFDGEMRWSAEWEPLFGALKRIASPEISASLGQGVAAERANFQLFVRGMLDGCAEEGDRPLVLIDSTGAAGLWPWLADTQLGPELTIGAERIDVSRRWPNTRLVRVRLGHGARIAERKTALYQQVDPVDGSDLGHEVGRYCPTIIARTVRLSAKGRAAHYWTTGSYFQMSLPRGLSVYRRLASFVPVAKLDQKVQVPGHKRLFSPVEIDITDVSYRLPNPIETTVAMLQEGDDPDRIAHLVASLREGYGHTAAATSLPAPLSFESKARDYMTRFGLDAAEDEDQDQDDAGLAGRSGEPTAEASAEDTEDTASGPALDAEAGLPATDRRAWRKLMDSKGISLMDSTSLSTSSLADDVTDVGASSRRSAPVGPVAPGQRSEHDEAVVQQPTVRRPILRLPAFITVEWLRGAVNVTNAQLRAMHEDRADIGRISGYSGWPDQKPDIEDFLALLPEAMRYPRFLALITQAVKRRRPPGKAQQWTPFIPIWKRAYSEARRILVATGDSVSVLDSRRKVAELLAGDGLAVLAMGNIVQQSYAFSPPDDVFELVETNAQFTELRAFMEDVRRELFHDDYDWFGDLRQLATDAEDGIDEADADTDGAPIEPPPASLPPVSVDDPEDEAGQGSALDLPEAPAAALDPGALWSAAMAEIAALALEAAAPDAATIDQLTERVRDAEAAVVAFEAARPRLVDASSAAAAAEDLIGQIERILADAAQPDAAVAAISVAANPMLAPDTLEQVEMELEELRASVGAARIKLDEALEIMRKVVVARLNEAVELRTEAVAEVRDAARQLGSLVERIADVADSAEQVRGEGPPAPIGEEPSARQVSPIEADKAHAPSESPSDEAVPNPSVPTHGPVIADDLHDSPTEDQEWEDYGDEPEPIAEEGAQPPTDATSIETSPPPGDHAAVDPIDAQIVSRFEALVAERQFGLAYHLQLAAEAANLGPGLPISQSELRLAAISQHINHAASQGSELVHRLLADAHRTLDTLDDDEPLADARRILALGYVAPFALYHADPEARLALDALRHVAAGLGEAAHSLRETLAMPFNLGLTLTPAMMRLASEEAEEDRYVQELTTRLVAGLDEFAKKTYKFQLGVKLRNVLSRSDGELGRLQERIERGGNPAIAAARAFATSYSDRGAILDLLEDAEKRTNNYKFTGIDGIARERMVGAIQGIAAICAEYVEATSAAPAFRGTRQNIQKARAAISAAVTDLVELLRSRESTDPLTAAATAYAIDALTDLLASVRGSAAVPAASDHLFALHGPLLWIAGLEFGQSWLPAPYLPEQVVGAVLDFDPDAWARDAADLAAATEARFKSGSHIASAMLIDAAGFYGVSVDAAQALSEARRADALTRRDALAVEVRDARLMVDRLQRMGGGTSQDEAQSLLSLLDRVNPDDLPIIVPPESRSENQEGQQILDFKDAYGLIGDVRTKVANLLQRPRDALLARIEELKDVAAEEDLEKVRGLVSRDDLLTAGEYIDFLQDGRALPESTSPNPRFHAFFPQVPQKLEAMSKDEREHIGAKVGSGVDVGPLLFSRISKEHRLEAAEVMEKWRELRRAVAGNLSDSDVVSRLAHLLGQFGINVEIRTSNARGNRRFYTTDLRFDLPLDRESVLLPDFGSLTGGDYRVCIAAKMPSEAELRALRRDAGALRLVIFVTDAMTAERRKQLLLSCLESSMRLLVIDDSIMFYAISEPELRGLTLFECAQPFSFAEPYRDYGNAAVPSEMFFGRVSEQRKLIEPHGSCIVYGGRRLGKTALLRHIQAEANDPDGGVAAAYVSILDLGAHAGEDQIWEYMSLELKDIFPQPVEDDQRFSEGVRRWLGVDSKRRVLMLLDESDRFIQADADKGFAQFVRLQRLMDDTNRRFKFVLAGLHNVTRLVHTENPPLKQIASDPQRIGPLMDEELGDAEALVVKPLAGMGYEFDNREDVWRILSYCNYYPVLVQKFCQQLVQQLGAETLRRRRPVTSITSDHIRLALENEAIAKEIGETFDYTISKIEDRYALIANIVAERVTRDAANGRIGEGMSAVEVRDAATILWPKAFHEANRLTLVEDLLDEMEGLGVLRRTPGGRWALRSPTILRLLGGDDKIVAKLGEFMDREAPPAFDPRSMRRRLKANPRMKVSEGDVCPLTAGQEHDILKDRAPVSLVFGNQLSSIETVSGALSSVGPGPDARRVIDVAARNWPAKDQLLKELRAAPGDRPILHVIDQATDWNADWVIEAGRIKPVREGRTRVLFVGNPSHALNWVNDPRTDLLSRELRIIALQTWSITLIDHMLQQEHLDPDQCRLALRSSTGGFNRPMQEAFAVSAGTPKVFKAKLESALARRRAEPSLPAELGLVGPMFELFTAVANYAGAGDVTAYEIGEGPIADLGLDMLGVRAVEFGLLMALLEAKVGPGGDDDDSRPYRLNPLLLAALMSEPS